MPLLPNALQQIRKNLEALSRGERPSKITIAQLTDKQTAAINERRAAFKPPLPAISGAVHLIGRHLYERRVGAQGYSIDDVLLQVASALSSESVLIKTQRGTLIQNKTGRDDGQGHIVQDIAVLECSGSRTGSAELYSAYPEGDGKGGD